MQAKRHGSTPREEVDDTLTKIKTRAETDDRIKIKEYEDLVMQRVTVHAFYVKYLLPIYFDVQVIEVNQPAA